MGEDKKIEKILEEYKDYLDKTNYDVCRSIKGKWFFFQYGEKNDDYECFYSFSNAEELEQIILGELIEDINIALECSAEEIVFASKNRIRAVNVEHIITNYNIADRMEELAENLKSLKNTIHLVDEVCVAMASMVEIAKKRTKNRINNE